MVSLMIISGGYYWYRSTHNIAATPQYILDTATKGTLIVSVSGTGQVSALNQIDIKPKASGTVLRVPVVAGQMLAEGAVVATLDARDAYKTVRDAELSLESAQLTLQKLVQPADTLAVIQAQSASVQAEQSKQKAVANLAKAYDDAFNAITNAFVDLPTIMTGLHDIFFLSTISAAQWNVDFYADTVKVYNNGIFLYKDDLQSKYAAAQAAYDQNFIDYKAVSRFSPTSTVTSFIGETYATTKSIAEAVKSAGNFIQFYKDQLQLYGAKSNTTADTHLTSLHTYTGTTNSHVSNLFTIKRTIETNQDDILNADRTIAEKAASFTKLQKGADPLDIKSQELTIRQKQAALLDAQTKLADYTIRTPISGIVATIAIKPTDQVGSTAVATIVGTQQLAEISLNEVDVAKIKVGQKATLTFDAIAGLSMTGEVAEIDTLGTITQGVVNYTVKIAFDTQDDRVKPGMSVSATIITDVKQNVLVIASNAVKVSGQEHYVEIFDNPPAQTNSQGFASDIPPRQQVVETGLSNDVDIEIISGLKEGDQIVIRTIAPAKTSATPAPSIFGAVGGGNRGLGGTSARGNGR